MTVGKGKSTEAHAGMITGASIVTEPASDPRSDQTGCKSNYPIEAHLYDSLAARTSEAVPSTKNSIKNHKPRAPRMTRNKVKVSVLGSRKKAIIERTFDSVLSYRIALRAKADDVLCASHIASSLVIEGAWRTHRFHYTITNNTCSIISGCDVPETTFLSHSYSGPRGREKSRFWRNGGSKKLLKLPRSPLEKARKRSRCSQKNGEHGRRTN